MSFRPLLWIGMISYGVYVYHMIVMTYWKSIPGLHLAEWQTAIIVTTITMLVSAISFYLYERPINNLKRYFSYRAPVQTEPRQVLALPERSNSATNPSRHSRIGEAGEWHRFGRWFFTLASEKWSLEREEEEVCNPNDRDRKGDRA